MDRIIRAITSSKYSIHDLSRCRGEGEQNLARFNMPLELGIAMAHAFAATSATKVHDWLVLIPEGHQYMRFISDLAGYDPKHHQGTADSIVPAVMSWLATRPDAVVTPTPRAVLRALPTFETAKRQLGEEWGAEVPWADLVIAARNIAVTL